MTGGLDTSRSHGTKKTGIIMGFSLAFTVLGAAMGLADHFLGIFGFAVVRQEVKDEMAHTAKRLEQAQAELADLKQRYALLEQEKRHIETRVASADSPARNQAQQGSTTNADGAAAAATPTPRPTPVPNARYREQVDGLYDLLRAESYDGNRSQLLRDHISEFRPELEFEDMVRILLLFESNYRYNILESMQRKLKSPLNREQIAELEKIDWGERNVQFKSDAIKLKSRLSE